MVVDVFVRSELWTERAWGHHAGGELGPPENSKSSSYQAVIKSYLVFSPSILEIRLSVVVAHRPFVKLCR